ncbi:hypothetical protein A3K88_24810 [Pseudomonas putida]|nr:hypothetical protein L483_16750 [Pseudomonas putida H8234]KLJ13984.1 hypothetical protein G1E_35560 [Pseudomonas sp. TJI-51]OAK55387.1 hypothetical protein A3K88_24810 [Pseudomonas putida]
MSCANVRLAQVKGLLNLHGWVYDIETGSIDALDADNRHFKSLAHHPATCAVPARPANRSSLDMPI